MKKRLISLMLAGAVLTGVGALAGCSPWENSDVFEVNDQDQIFETPIGENLIVALHEKLVTLHKAKISTVTWHVRKQASYIINKVDTDCGESVYASNLIIYAKMPSADKYDIICEECFPNQN